MMQNRDALRVGLSLLESQQIEDARLDAELLLAGARGISRASLLARLDEPLDEASRARFDAWLARRAQHEPVAYILGHKAFYGLDLLVDRRVLIPRPETELLVELALQLIGDRGQRTGERLVMVDVGTGSGAVAVSLAVKLAPSPAHLAGVVGVTIIASDISMDALEVARANAARYGLGETIQFVQCDLLANIGRADLVVANLPYVARDEWASLAPEITQYEPRVALYGGADGLDLFRHFFAQTPARLVPGGLLLLEIGAGQAEAVSRLARAAFAGASIEVKQDLAGRDRIVIVRS